MAELSREEVCVGAARRFAKHRGRARWFAKHRGTVRVNRDVARVYFGVCMDEQTLSEVVESWSAGRANPLTPEHAEAAWRKLVGMAEEMGDRPD
jgi:hypothetical protein